MHKANDQVRAPKQATWKRAVKAVLPVTIRRLISRILFSTAALYLWNPSYRRRQAAVRRLLQHVDPRVQSGPFAGLFYVGRSVGSTFAPKILGTYEKELWGAVEDAITRDYSTIIDIGAAEGYYAVGLAHRVPLATVICFEAQTREHRLLKQLAALNGVHGRISVKGFCTPSLLNDSLSGDAPCLVVCDAEGSEVELLDPAQVPALRRADILVEIHEFIRPGVATEILRRFESSHEINRIPTQPRVEADWPASVEVDRRYRLDLLDEWRPARMEWFWMLPKG